MTTKRSTGAVWFLLLALALVLGGAALAVAETPDADATEPAEPVAAESATDETAEATEGVSGVATMRVVIDPETGQLRAPTPEEAAAFAIDPAPARDIESMRIEKAADGTMTVRLGGAFLKAALARVTPEGDVEVSHDVVPAVEAPATEAVPATETAETEENR